MKYLNFKNEVQLSRLGMGNMRLPVKADEPERPIDYEKAKAIIDEAMSRGVNYFDTAYIYHGGESERFTGMALAEYPRANYHVADKFNIQANPDYKAQFSEQLKRLQLDYIDFYLIHGIQDSFVDECISSGCIDWFGKMKMEGKIKYLGFSYHGSPAVLRRLIGLYPWDFVQIQLNYYDWLYGDAKLLYEILKEAGIPVFVMEPVYGGMLADLGQEANALLRRAAPNRSIASWAMRWVMSLDNVAVILSGMNSIEQLDDNIQTVSENRILTGDEHLLIEEACAILRKDVSVACTGCRYCCPECPAGLDIPALLSSYNDAKIGGAWRLNRLRALPPEKLPSACIGCGACTRYCPQRFDIPRYMKELSEMIP